MKLIAGLSVSLGLAVIVAIVCGWQWASASAECDARVANRERELEAAASQKYQDGIDTGTRIQGESRVETADAVAAGLANTADRAVRIVRVPTTGGCTMPAGLPPLDTAAQEARDASR